METALWIAQALLAAIFLATGLTKLTQPRAKLAAGPMRWAADVTDGQFRTIGLLEVLGAAGLIRPAALGIAEVLTPLAAVGLALTMVGAVVAHVRHGEVNRLAVPIVLMGLALSSPSRCSGRTACDRRQRWSMPSPATMDRRQRTRDGRFWRRTPAVRDHAPMPGSLLTQAPSPGAGGHIAEQPCDPGPAGAVRRGAAGVCYAGHDVVVSDTS